MKFMTAYWRGALMIDNHKNKTLSRVRAFKIEDDDGVIQ